jgi:hypothetical protein
MCICDQGRICIRFQKFVLPDFRFPNVQMFLGIVMLVYKIYLDKRAVQNFEHPKNDAIPQRQRRFSLRFSGGDEVSESDVVYQNLHNVQISDDQELTKDGNLPGIDGIRFLLDCYGFSPIDPIELCESTIRGVKAVLQTSSIQCVEEYSLVYPTTQSTGLCAAGFDAFFVLEGGFLSLHCSAEESLLGLTLLAADPLLAARARHAAPHLSDAIAANLPFCRAMTSVSPLLPPPSDGSTPASAPAPLPAVCGSISPPKVD